MDRFFVSTPPPIGDYVLTGDEAHHLAAVRRFAAGDRVTLFCGDGREFPATVTDAAKKSVSLLVEPPVTVSRERPHDLVVLAAMPKGDRGDFLVEKLVELGAARFVPLLTERTVVEPKANRVENLRRLVIEASKQCGRNVLMRVDAPTKWAAALKDDTLPPSRFVLHTDEGQTLIPGPAAVAVGPEGGFADREVEAAISAGWIAASLGPRVLRVETAAIAAAAVL